MLLEIPTCKVDVYRPADVVEEILRIYGYDNIGIPEKLNASINVSAGINSDKVQQMVSDMLSANGFYEIMNNSLTRSAYTENHPAFDQNNNVIIINPLSKELDVMRQNLVFGGLETIAYNHNRKQFDLKLYEFGKTYQYKPSAQIDTKGLEPYSESFSLDVFMTGNQTEEIWNKPTTALDFFDLKQVAESIINRINIDRKKISLTEESNDLYEYSLVYMHGETEIARLGKLSANTLKPFDIRKSVFHASLKWTLLLSLIPKKSIRYEAVPKYPAVRRDLALVLDKNIRFETLQQLAFATEKQYLQQVSIFDVYEGDKIPEGKKSYALSFVILDKEKTLTDQVIEKTMNKIQQAFEKQLGAVLR